MLVASLGTKERLGACLGSLVAAMGTVSSCQLYGNQKTIGFTYGWWADWRAWARVDWWGRSAVGWWWWGSAVWGWGPGRGRLSGPAGGLGPGAAWVLFSSLATFPNEEISVRNVRLVGSRRSSPPRRWWSTQEPRWRMGTQGPRWWMGTLGQRGWSTLGPQRSTRRGCRLGRPWRWRKAQRR